MTFILGVAAAAGLAVVAVAVEHSGLHLFSRFRESLANRRWQHGHEERRQLFMEGIVEQWLIDYEISAGRGDSLGSFQSSGQERRLAVYSPSAWQASTALPAGDVRPVRPLRREAELLPERVAPPRPVSRHMRRTANEIWDGPSLTNAGLPHSVDDCITPVESGYWNIAPQMIELEEEAIACAGSQFWRRPRRRKAIDDVFDSVERGVGGTVVFVVEEVGAEPRVLLHRRSLKVATNPGLICTIPTYVVENNRPGEKSELDLVAWNVLRELLEEAFDKSEVERPAIKPTSDWFFNDDGIGSDLFAAAKDGRLQFFHLGWFVNLINGLLDMMTLAYLRGTSEQLQMVQSQLEGNEHEIHAGYDSLWFAELLSDQLSDLCLSGAFHPGCALAIARAREIVAQLRNP